MQTNFGELWGRYLGTSGLQHRDTALREFLVTVTSDRTQLFPTHVAMVLGQKIAHGLLRILLVRTLSKGSAKTQREIRKKGAKALIVLLLRATAKVLEAVCIPQNSPIFPSEGDDPTLGVCAVIGDILRLPDDYLYRNFFDNNSTLFGDVCIVLRLILTSSSNCNRVLEVFSPHSGTAKKLLQCVKWNVVGNELTFDKWLALVDTLLHLAAFDQRVITLLIENDIICLALDLAEAHCPHTESDVAHWWPLVGIHVLGSMMSMLIASLEISPRLVQAYVAASSRSLAYRATLESIAEFHVVRSSAEAMLCCRVLLLQVCMSEEFGWDHVAFVDHMLHHVLPACAVPGGKLHVYSELSMSSKASCNLTAFNTLLHILRRCVPRSHFGEEGPCDVDSTFKRHVLVCVLGLLGMFGEYFLRNAQYMSAIRPFTVAMESFFCDMDATMQSQLLHGMVDFIRLYVSSRKFLPPESQEIVNDLSRSLIRDIILAIQHTVSAESCAAWRVLSGTRALTLLTDLLTPTLAMPDSSSSSVLDELFVGGRYDITSSLLQLVTTNDFITKRALVLAALEHIRSLLARSSVAQSVLMQNMDLLSTLCCIMMYAGPTYGSSSPSTGLYYFHTVVEILHIVARQNEVQQTMCLQSMFKVLKHGEPIYGSSLFLQSLSMKAVPDPHSEHCHHWMHHDSEEGLTLDTTTPTLPCLPPHVSQKLHICVRAQLTLAMTEISSVIPHNKRCLREMELLPWVFDILKAMARTTAVSPSLSPETLDCYSSEPFEARVSEIFSSDILTSPPSQEEALILQMDFVHLLTNLVVTTFDGFVSNRADLQVLDIFENLKDFELSNSIIGVTLSKALLRIALQVSALPIAVFECPVFGQPSYHPCVPSLSDLNGARTIHHPDFIMLMFQLFEHAARKEAALAADVLEIRTLRYLTYLCRWDDNALRVVKAGLLSALLAYISRRFYEELIPPAAAARDLPERTSGILYLRSSDSLLTDKDATRPYPPHLASEALAILCELVTLLGQCSLSVRDIHTVRFLAASPSLEASMYCILRQWAAAQTLQPHTYIRFPFTPSPSYFEQPSGGPISMVFLQPLKLSPWPPESGYSTTIWFKVCRLERPSEPQKASSEHDLTLVSFLGARKSVLLDIGINASRRVSISMSFRKEDGRDEWLTTTDELPEHEVVLDEWQFLSVYHTWSLSTQQSKVVQTITARLNNCMDNSVQYTFQTEVTKSMVKLLGTTYVDTMILGKPGVPRGSSGLCFAASLELATVMVLSGSLSKFEHYFLYSLGADYAGDINESLFINSHFEVMQSQAAMAMGEDLSAWLSAYMSVLQGGRATMDSVNGGHFAPRLILRISPTTNGDVMFYSRSKEYNAESWNVQALYDDREAPWVVVPPPTITTPNADRSGDTMASRTPRRSSSLQAPEPSMRQSSESENELEGGEVARINIGYDNDMSDAMMAAPTEGNPSTGSPLIPRVPVADVRVKTWTSRAMTITPSTSVLLRYSMKSFARSMGGLPSLLWLLSTATTSATQVLAVNILRHMVAYNPDLTRWVMDNGGYESLAFFLKQPRVHLTQSMLEATLSFTTGACDQILCNTAAFRDLVLDFSIWTRAPIPVQSRLFSHLHHLITGHAFAAFHTELFRRNGCYEALLFHLHQQGFQRVSFQCPSIDICHAERIRLIIKELVLEPPVNGLLQAQEILNAIAMTHSLCDGTTNTLPIPETYTKYLGGGLFSPEWRRELLFLYINLLVCSPTDVVEVVGESQVGLMLGLLFDHCTLTRKLILEVFSVLLTTHVRSQLYTMRIFDGIAQQYGALRNDPVAWKVLSDPSTDPMQIIDVFEASLDELQVVWRWATGENETEITHLANADVIARHYLPRPDHCSAHIARYIAYLEDRGMKKFSRETTHENATLQYPRNNKLRRVSIAHEEALLLFVAMGTGPIRNAHCCTSMFKRTMAINALTALFICGNSSLKNIFVAKQVHTVLLNEMHSQRVGEDPFYLKAVVRLLQEIACFQMVTVPCLGIELPPTADANIMATTLMGLTRCRFSMDVTKLLWLHIMSSILAAFETQFPSLSREATGKAFFVKFVDPYIAFSKEALSSLFVIQYLFTTVASVASPTEATLLESTPTSTPLDPTTPAERPPLEPSTPSFMSRVAGLFKSTTLDPTTPLLAQTSDTFMYVSPLSDYLRCAFGSERKCPLAEVWSEEASSLNDPEASLLDIDPLDVENFQFFLVSFTETLMSVLRKKEGVQIFPALISSTLISRRDDESALLHTCNTQCLRMLETKATAPFALLFWLHSEDSSRVRRDKALFHADMATTSWAASTTLGKESYLCELTKDEKVVVSLLRGILRNLTPEEFCTTTATLCQRVLRVVIAYKHSVVRKILLPGLWQATRSGSGILHELLENTSKAPLTCTIDLLVSLPYLNAADKFLDTKHQDSLRILVSRKEIAGRFLDKPSTKFNVDLSRLPEVKISAIAQLETSIKLFKSSWEETTRRVARYAYERIHLQPLWGEVANLRTQWRHVNVRWKVSNMQGPNFMRSFNRRYFYTPIYEALGLRTDKSVDVGLFTDLDLTVGNHLIHPGDDADEYRLLMHHGEETAQEITPEEVASALTFPCQLVHAMNIIAGEVLITTRGVHFRAAQDAFAVDREAPGFVELLKMNVELPPAIDKGPEVLSLQHAGGSLVDPLPSVPLEEQSSPIEFSQEKLFFSPDPQGDIQGSTPCLQDYLVEAVTASVSDVFNDDQPVMELGEPPVILFNMPSPKKRRDTSPPDPFVDISAPPREEVEPPILSSPSRRIDANPSLPKERFAHISVTPREGPPVRPPGVVCRLDSMNEVFLRQDSNTQSQPSKEDIYEIVPRSRSANVTACDSPRSPLRRAPSPLGRSPRSLTPPSVKVVLSPPSTPLIISPQESSIMIPATPGMVEAMNFFEAATLRQSSILRQESETEVPPRPIASPKAIAAKPHVIKKHKGLQKKAIVQMHQFDGRSQIFIPLVDIRGVYPRRYLLQRNSIEVYTHRGESYFFAFADQTSFAAAKTRLDTLALNVDKNIQPTKEALFHWQNAWISGQISNFSYLQFLNLLAGRTLNDLTQYPVFPHVIADFNSPTLDLSNPSSFRNLALPMGCQTETRREKAIAKYEMCVEVEEQPFHHGTHYSTRAGVLYYLQRSQPFTDYFLELNGMKLDEPGRTFYSVPLAYAVSSSQLNPDVKEMIPEFYYNAGFYTNRNCISFGYLDNGAPVSECALPPWCRGDSRALTLMYSEALESRYVSEHLHEWIDLIFGCLQRGPAAREALNVFHPYTYEGTVDIAHEDPLMREAIVTQISNYGQCPQQILFARHPKRNLQEIYGKRALQFQAAWCRSPVTAMKIRIYHCPELLHVKETDTRQYPHCIGQVMFAFGSSKVFGTGPRPAGSIMACRPEQVLLLHGNNKTDVDVLTFSTLDGTVHAHTYADDLTPLIILRSVNKVMRYTCCTVSRKDTNMLFLGTSLGHIDIYIYLTTSSYTSANDKDPLGAMALAPSNRGGQKGGGTLTYIPPPPQDRKKKANTNNIASRSCADQVLTEGNTGSANFRWMRYESSLYGHTNPITSVEISKEWGLLVSIDEGGVALLWDVEGKVLMHVLRVENCGPSAKFFRAAINELTGDIVTASSSPQGQYVLHLWNFNGEILACSGPVEGLVTSLCFCHSALFVGLSTGTLTVLDTFDLSPRAFLRQAHRHPVTAIAVNETCSRVASGDQSGTVLQWWLRSVGQR